MGMVDRLRARIRPMPSTEGVAGKGGEIRTTSDLLQAGGTRFPTLYHNGSRVNPYKPLVLPIDFPSILGPTNINIPPSIQPQMIIRRGPTPMPTGATVPAGSSVGRKVIGVYQEKVKVPKR